MGIDTCGRKGNTEVLFRKNEYENKTEISKNNIWLKNINIEKNEKKSNKMGGVKVKIVSLILILL